MLMVLTCYDYIRSDIAHVQLCSFMQCCLSAIQSAVFRFVCFSCLGHVGVVFKYGTELRVDVFVNEDGRKGKK